MDTATPFRLVQKSAVYLRMPTAKGCGFPAPTIADGCSPKLSRVHVAASFFAAIAATESEESAVDGLVNVGIRIRRTPARIKSAPRQMNFDTADGTTTVRRAHASSDGDIGDEIVESKAREGRDSFLRWSSIHTHSGANE